MKRSMAMWNPINVFVPGVPKPLKRPRFSRGRVFDPSKQDKIEFLRMFAQFCPDLVPAPKDTALRISLSFYFPRPKAHFRTGRYAHLLKDSAPPYWNMIKTPDVDNLVKFVLDALNGNLYVDDKQVVELEARKCYVNEDYNNPGTLVSALPYEFHLSTASQEMSLDPSSVGCVTDSDDENSMAFAS